MTNREKYVEEILDIACSHEKMAVNKESGKPAYCSKLRCVECLFLNSCNEDEFIKWSNAEYVERPKISKRDKNFLYLLQGKWNYMARNRDGSISVFTVVPYKSECKWIPSTLIGESHSLGCTLDLDFPMIKWEDKKPWNISDLYGLEEVKKYENN